MNVEINGVTIVNDLEFELQEIYYSAVSISPDNLSPVLKR
jgi:hypothetical protein